MSGPVYAISLELIADKLGSGLDFASSKLKQFSGDAEKQISVLKTLGSIVGLAAIGGGIVKFYDEAIKAASQYEVEYSRLNTVIENSGRAAGFSTKQLADYASQIEENSTFTEESVMKAEATLARFSNLTGDTYKRTLQVAVDMAASTGKDLEGVAVMLGRSLANPTMAARALSQAGIVLSKNQREALSAMQETGRGAEATGIILQALENKYRGAAEAAGKTLPGATIKLHNAVDQLLRIAGEQGLVGIITKLQLSLVKLAQDEGVKTFFAFLGKAGTSAVDMIMALVAAVELVGPAWTAMGNAAMVEFDHMKIGLGQLLQDAAKFVAHLPGMGDAAASMTSGGKGLESSGKIGLAVDTAKETIATAQLEVAYGKVDKALQTWLDDYHKGAQVLAENDKKSKDRLGDLRAETEAEKKLREELIKRTAEVTKLMQSLEAKNRVEKMKAADAYSGGQSSESRDLEVANAIIETRDQLLAKGVPLWGTTMTYALSITAETTKTAQNLANWQGYSKGIVDVFEAMASSATAANDEKRQGQLDADKMAARIKDQKELQAVTMRYGKTVADILQQYGLLDTATKQLTIHEEALQKVRGGDTRSLEEIEASLQAAQAQVDAVAQVGANQDIVKAKSVEFYSQLGEVFSAMSTAAGGTSTLMGRLSGDLGKAAQGMSQFADAMHKADKEGQALAAAGIAGAIGGVLKDLNIGGAGKTGGAQSFGGKLDSNYAGIGAVVGTIVGAIIGAVATWGGGAGAGAALGSAIGTVLGSLISKAGDWAAAKLENGQIKVEEANSKLSGAIASALQETLRQAVQGLSSLGLSTIDLPGIDIKIRDNMVRVIAGAMTRTFNSMQDAISFAVTESIKEAATKGGSGLDPQVLAAIRNSNADSLEGLQSDIDFARHLINFGLPQVVSDMDKYVTQFFTNMARAAQLGLDQTNVVKEFVQQMQAAKDSLLGINRNLSPQDQMRRDAAAFNQKADMVEAQAKLDQAELLTKKADLASKIIIARAQIQLDKAELSMDEEKLQVQMAVIQAEQEALSGMVLALDATNQALIANQSLIDSIIHISDQELADALSHIHGNGGSNPRGDFIKEHEGNVANFGKGQFEQAMDQLMKDYAEQTKGLKATSKELAILLALRDHEAALLKAQTRVQVRQDYQDYIHQADPTYNVVVQAQRAAKTMGDEVKDAFKSGAIGAAEFARKMAMIANVAQQVQFADLTDAARSILGGLYDYLGMTKESEELKHTIAVAQLLAAEASLKSALAIADLTPGMRDAIQKMIDGMGPLIDKVVNDPNYGNSGSGGGGSSTPFTPPGMHPNGHGGWDPDVVPGSAGGDGGLAAALAKLADYENQGMSPLARSLKTINDDFAQMRSVLGDSLRLQNAYNAAIQRVMDEALAPYRDMLKELTTSDLSPLNLEQRIQQAQTDFFAAASAIQGGDLTHLGDLPGMLQNLLQLAQTGLPVGSQAYATLFAAGNSLLQQILTQYSNPANVPGAGGVGGPVGTGTGTGGTAPAAGDGGSAAVVDAVQVTGVQQIQLLQNIAGSSSASLYQLQNINANLDRGIFIRQTA